jgi:hypothetical protein
MIIYRTTAAHVARLLCNPAKSSGAYAGTAVSDLIACLRWSTSARKRGWSRRQIFSRSEEALRTRHV